jgi:plastocyanin
MPHSIAAATITRATWDDEAAFRNACEVSNPEKALRHREIADAGMNRFSPLDVVRNMQWLMSVISNSEDFMSSLRLALVPAIALFAAACTSSPSSPSSMPSPNGPSVVIPTGASTLGNRAYNPDTINVAIGDTVTWTNTDSEAHTSTSDGSVWNSGVVAAGGQFSTKFQNAGTFTYHCTIHPGMVGTVVVR